MAISRPCHVPLWPQDHWLAYPQRTDAHGVAPTRETEIIDLAAGIRVVHPNVVGEFDSVAWDDFQGT